MRWKAKRKPTTNEERTRTFFALFPIKCQKEYRWLEIVTVTQKYLGNKWISTHFK